MAPDLTPLERAAERAGLAGLRARIVPPDPRRGTWFAWDARSGDLAVSERVIERCPPQDAAALLIGEVLAERRLAGLRRSTRWGLLAVGAGTTAAVALTAGGDATDRAIGVGMLILLPLLLLIFWLGARTRLTFDADDETVRLLGDAEPLVRGLNRMNQDEVVIGPLRAAARPDLHRRAERLALRHRLCALPSEQDPPGPR